MKGKAKLVVICCCTSRVHGLDQTLEKLIQVCSR